MPNPSNRQQQQQPQYFRFLFSNGRSRRISFTTTNVHNNEMTGSLHVDIERVLNPLPAREKKKKNRKRKIKSNSKVNFSNLYEKLEFWFLNHIQQSHK
jgi:hypothetical protein